MATTYEKISDTEVKVITTTTAEKVKLLSDIKADIETLKTEKADETARYQALLTQVAAEHQAIIDDLTAQRTELETEALEAGKLGIK